MEDTSKWKFVPGTENRYIATPDGRVAYLSWTTKSNKHLTCGYKKIQITRHGKKKNFYVHRLIAETFLTNPQQLSTVNHKNGVKLDNSVENLEWASRKYQMEHAMALGLWKPGLGLLGVRNPMAKHTVEQVKEVKELYAKGINSKQISKQLGLKYTTVYKITRGIQWKSIN